MEQIFSIKNSLSLIDFSNWRPSMEDLKDQGQLLGKYVEEIKLKDLLQEEQKLSIKLHKEVSAIDFIFPKNLIESLTQQIFVVPREQQIENILPINPSQPGGIFKILERR